MSASPSPSSSEGILQEVRRASTYVAFVETDHQTGALRLSFPDFFAIVPTMWVVVGKGGGLCCRWCCEIRG